MSKRLHLTRGERLWALDIAMVMVARMAKWRSTADGDMPPGTLDAHELERVYEVLFEMSLQEQARRAK